MTDTHCDDKKRKFPVTHVNIQTEEPPPKKKKNSPMVIIPNVSEPHLFPKNSELISCSNKSHGCPKKATWNNLIYHQKICTYQPFKCKYREINVRSYESTGFIHCNLSDGGTYYAFNNSFLKMFGIQFFFAMHSDTFSFHSYSSKISSSDLKFKLKVYLEGVDRCVNIKVSDEPKFFSFGKTVISQNKMFKYKLECKIKDNPVIVE